MPWNILCPTCGVFLKIDDNGKSLPDAEYKFVNDVFCGNCGRDMTASLKRAKETITEINMERAKYKNPPQS